MCGHFTAYYMDSVHTHRALLQQVGAACGILIIIYENDRYAFASCFKVNEQTICTAHHNLEPELLSDSHIAEFYFSPSILKLYEKCKLLACTVVCIFMELLIVSSGLNLRGQEILAAYDICRLKPLISTFDDTLPDVDSM